ncbi:FAD dependent oxidoreductase [Algoriphagus chordae]|uniref:FAD dependent oxidoreductase n=2 Tax=Algoriphagus chordae TaxID=237019 RepID=A0A2W7REL8_9BACT|nr:FAD dependent oxidoreductase [Algoriphagus chordae]
MNVLNKFKFCLLAFMMIFALGSCKSGEEQENITDVIVYGGTSGAITAAIQAKKMGKSVIMVSPDKHLGGLTAGGLGWTDTGKKEVIGGLSREFYQKIYDKYESESGWKWESQSDFGNKGQGTPAIDGEFRTMWIFEPHVAEEVFDDWVKELGIELYRDEWLDRESGVTVENGEITAIRTLSGKEFKGKMFIDATYEGDLMAASGVSYHVGREAGSVYNEEWNGIQTGVYDHRHHFQVLDNQIDPYWIPGDPSSGLIPKISSENPGVKGEGDNKIQAYCFRTCMSNHPDNRVPFPKPDNYDSSQYELLVRIFDAGWREWFGKFDMIPNRKTDTNNHGPFSSDNIGMNYEYPEANYERRKEIIKEHEDYQKGLLYFVANDPRVPKETQEEFQNWGLAKDEFIDNGNWPHQIYVREARRMVGEYVMTENELLQKKPTPESIGMGSYTIDSHNIQRYVDENGHVQNEGDIGVGLPGPYEISYGSIIPKKGEIKNLVVPVAVSASHIAFGSIRMEPVFMILGQSAATAAVMAINEGLSVQDLPYEKLRLQLISDGQVLKLEDQIK